MSGVAAAVGVIVAREFGRGPDTDGFFAAYAVFLVLSLAATALRVVVLPPLARAIDPQAETGSWAVALAVVAVPLLAISTFAPRPAAELFGLGDRATDVAADGLVWLVPAGVAQMYAGLIVSALAARSDYVTAALGYALGAAAGLSLILWRLDDGIVAVSWGVALNGAVALAVPLARVRLRAVRPGRRLVQLARGVALPLALQTLYVVALRFAAGLEVGEVSDLSYAYLIASGLVAVTASSIGLTSSVPLARAGVSSEEAARHVVLGSWLALSCVAGAAGFFAVGGGPLVRAVLGDAYGGDLGRLVALLAPWMAASVGVSLTYPLVFVTSRAKRLVRLAFASVAVHVLLTWAGREWLGAEGIVLALALTTFAILVALLAILSPRTLAPVASGLALAAVTTGSLAAATFAAGAFVFDSTTAASVGLAAYAAILVGTRPAGLRRAWAYVRSLD